MPRFAANLTMMYNEHPFLERFGACAADGFEAVECQFPYVHGAAEIRDELDRHGLRLVLINAPAGDWAAGERGVAALPGRREEFRRGVDLAIEYATALDCPRIHLMAGIVGRGAERVAHLEAYVDNLAWAAQRLGDHGLEALIEPINPRDFPGYLLNLQAEAHAIVERIGAPNLKVQMDLYHCQVVEGDLATRIRRHFARIGHVQVAGVPHRHEPDLGEVHYPYLFELLDALGYEGWIGCEYRPRAGTSAGLGWLRALRGG
ncbi:2-oxo-tetronate isomerase [Quisquiliibacterium transsilvanicum]|uniref:Hydroxypyruvate isomerase n=1 Tax=Quisquiliibacterium transsilvanicum TaxID=1549638 RepID=A0A7W8HHK0_9BURK|nr:2-oxo-tetronate isomerase [Quisquiliibacterium transsilvanicum]MBB5272184.1 hydroxypyruvate isomerase [Quisquiliibacterium transsilvanicum]